MKKKQKRKTSKRRSSFLETLTKTETKKASDKVAQQYINPKCFVAFIPTEATVFQFAQYIIIKSTYGRERIPKVYFIY